MGASGHPPTPWAVLVNMMSFLPLWCTTFRGCKDRLFAHCLFKDPPRCMFLLSCCTCLFRCDSHTHIHPPSHHPPIPHTHSTRIPLTGRFRGNIVVVISIVAVLMAIAAGWVCHVHTREWTIMALGQDLTKVVRLIRTDTEAMQELEVFLKTTLGASIVNMQLALLIPQVLRQGIVSCSWKRSCVCVVAARVVWFAIGGARDTAHAGPKPPKPPIPLEHHRKVGFRPRLVCW